MKKSGKVKIPAKFLGQTPPQPLKPTAKESRMFKHKKK